MAFKYAADAGAVALATGPFWSPLDYLLPFYLLRAEKLAGAPAWFLPAFVLWTLPFLWIGVAMTLRRAVDAGRSPWLALAFFVPLVNYVVMLALCRLPTVPLNPREDRAGDRAPRAGRGRTSRQSGGRDSRPRRARRGARPDSAVRSGRLGRGCRTSGGGVAQRGELQ